VIKAFLSELGQAIRSLLVAFTRALLPRPLWLAGIAYPSLQLEMGLLAGAVQVLESSTGISTGWTKAGTEPALELIPGFPIALSSPGTVFLVTLLTMPVALMLFRGVAGLAISARQTTPSGGRWPGLAPIWRAGKDTGTPALGIWVLIQGLLFAAMLILLGPLLTLVQFLGLETWRPFVLALALPILGLLGLYGLVLLVLNQLALHSLVCHGRGIASALTHAWRLAKEAPMRVTAYAACDLALFLGTLLVAHGLQSLATGEDLGTAAAEILYWGTFGAAGVTRAGLWCRGYDALGGLPPQ